MKFDPFKDLCVDVIIYDAIKKDIYEFLKSLKEKYKSKLNDIKDIREGQVGFKKFEIPEMIYTYIRDDKDLGPVYRNKERQKLITKRMVKKAFKDCFNEILDETPIIDVNGEQVNPKTKRMLLAEKIVNETLNGTIDPVVLKGLEVIRDTIGEKPSTEIISKGIEAKIIDVNVTNDKVEKVKNILDSLREKRVLDGLKQNINVGRSVEGLGNEGTTEVSVSRELERVHNVDVLPDKQD